MSEYSSDSSADARHHTATHTPDVNETSSQSSFSGNESVPETPAVKDPSAIIGMACRLPGVTNTHELWKVLSQKTDLRRKMPEDRFNVDAFYHPQGANKGTTNAKYGYFLDQGLDEFDAQFFNISGKEAEAMDPQQRILLEVVYEALENAGITLDEISGTQTSVYCGSFSNDYNSMTNKDAADYPKYSVTGVGNAVISNRISYCYNLHGPSYTIDTACSSSLVCFHLANESLQRGECETAIVCGSALHFDPTIFVTMTDFGMLSADGRCRAFDAKGSGYVRSEGICAIILRKQSFAESSGDSIRAIICGTGSNHDGLKEGLTLPNDIAQARLLRQTYKKAGLDTCNTDYFEAHGTGTAVGDPREIAAIGSVFASGRENPLAVGSIKSNLGHTEGASGAAGIIKTVLSIEAGVILPNMHFEDPNPNIDFQSAKIEIPTKAIDWIGQNGVRRASVNSFGYGGTNAHAILQNYRPRILNNIINIDVPSIVENRPYLVPLTAHSDNAGKLLISKLVDYLTKKPDTVPADLAYSLSTRRSMHRHRSFVIGNDQGSILHSLENPSPTQSWTKTLEHKPRLGFVFTGQGAQWFAMGRQLIEECPLFRQTIERCDEVLQRLPDSPSWSCMVELTRSEKDSKLSRSVYSQPVCAALQLAVIELLKTWGINPSAVIGHSSGEIVAAYSAGILSFDNTIICAYYRGLYMSKGIGSTKGSMMAVGLTEEEGKTELEAYRGRIALAAVNSPSSLTLSGDEDAIMELKSVLDGRKIFARQLQVEQAFHSHHMIPLAPGFEKALSNTPGFKANKSGIPMFSSVTARNSSGISMDARYWAANMTGQVRFSDALTDLLLNEEDELRVDIVIEIGAHPALRGPSKQVMKTLNVEVPYLASLTRTDPAFKSLLNTAGQLHALGYPVDLVAVNSNHVIKSNGDLSSNRVARKLNDLPSYAWDHGKYWAETRVIRENRLRQNRHTILGAPVPGAPSNHPRWRNYLRLHEISWLSQHVVDGKILFPAAGYISMALEAVATITPSFKKIHLRDIMFKSALIISGSDTGTEIMLDLEPQAISSKSTSNTWYRFKICSFDENYRTIENCHGLISAEDGVADFVDTLNVDKSYTELQKSSTRSRKHEIYYKKLTESALQYGEDFQLLSGDIENGDGFSLSGLVYKPANVITTPTDACILHPTVLDASFHTVFAAIESQLGRSLDDAFVPTFIRFMTVSGLLHDKKHNSGDQDFWVKCDTRLPGSRVAINHISIQEDRSNNVLVDLNGLELTALGNEVETESDKCSLFFRIKWQPLFESVGKTNKIYEFDGISDVMSTYCHQFPNAKILHVSPSLEASREVLSLLGGNHEARRRFQSVSIISVSGETDIQERLAIEYPGLVETEEPKTSSFDAIVFSEAPANGLTSFIKEDGHLICDGVDLELTGLVKLFQSGKFSVFQKQSNAAELRDELEDIAIVLSTCPSLKTKQLMSHIQSLHKGAISQISLADMLQVGHAHKNIIMLASLDEDVFFEPGGEESTNFQAIQKLLTSQKKNVVWLLESSSHETSRPEQAIILGLARAARSENEETRIVTLDFPLNYNVSICARRSLDVLASSINEDELAERDGILYVPRVDYDDLLNRKLPNGGHRQPQLEKFKQDRKLALKIGKVGLLDTLRFEDDDDVLRELGDDEVEVEVKASALNFRDIAASVGIIDDYRLGDECSGIVTRTGRNVEEAKLKKGDRVFAWRPGQGSHRSVVYNPALFTIKIGDMDFVTAASLSAVLSTAYYSLVDVARLQPGEYCLIHAAAGGVGQMAVQVAQMVGAKVIATCGAQSKRDYLKQTFGLSDEVIFSSRDLSFVEGVMNLTNGRGCDVALNSLAGELLHATWSCIAPFGRMIEIGKRDIHENTKLDMDPFRKNVSYSSIDLITIFNLNPVLGSQLCQKCFELVKSGTIKPPGPIAEVSYAEAQKGFRMLQMGKFFGKVVLVPGDADVVPVMPPVYRNTTLFNAEKTYLLVGGLGGLGRSLSQWMLRKGARKIAFLSRSGVKTAQAQATVDWLVARNVEVSVFSCDVTNEKEVTNCVQSIGKNLAGIFQAAMVLRDIPLAQMNIEQWRACVYPKIRGAYNLHTATLKQKLDFFVCFSSSSAIVGAMAQANYAAANAYLDALMRHRRENNLAGFTMNVGRVGGIGVVAENDALEKFMDRIGYLAINEEELFYQIEEAVSSQVSSTQRVGGIDQHQLLTGLNISRKDLYWASKPLFRNLYSNLDLLGQGSKLGSSKSLSVTLRTATDLEERTNILREAFKEKVAAVLAVPVTTVQAGNSLSVYGLDSIVAVEFRKWFSKSVGVDLALFDILGAKSIEALTVQVSSMIDTSSNDADVDFSNHKLPESNAKEGTINAPGLVVADLSEEFAIANRPKKIPMSTFQKRMWFLHNILEDPSSLNFVVTCFIKGQPIIDVFERTLREVVQRNEILRTAYLEGDQYAEQVVIDDVPVHLEFADVSGTTNPKLSLEAYTKELRSKTLNIEEGEVTKASLVKMSSSEYAFVLVAHHIALDNGSSKSSVDQITQLYDSLVKGEDITSVASPKFTYADFTLWHKRKLESPELALSLKWWEDMFANAPSSNKLLPFAKVDRPAKASRQRHISRITLGLSLLKRMKRICTRATVTPFQFILAAFRAFVYRYTQEDDLTILMVDGNRPHPMFDDVLGFFVNTVPLRFRDDCEQTFDHLLAAVKLTTLRALSHSQVPFDAIVDAVKARSPSGHSPLGQIAINYQMYGKAPKFKTSHFEIYDVTNEDIPNACDIALEITEDPATGLLLRLEHDTDLYGSTEMDKFFENFSVFLKDVVKDFRQPISEIDMCGTAEINYLKENCWASNAVRNDWENQPVWDRVSEIGARQPQSIAITTSDGDSITYGELLTKSSNIAKALQSSGASPTRLVGILADPGIEMVATMMAAIRLRCGYVPLDPEFAPGRLEHMTKDASISILVFDENNKEQSLRLEQNHELALIAVESVSCDSSTTLALSHAEPQDPFYVIYTSGSTGKPKGVMLTHENTQAMLSSHNAIHDFNPKDTILFHSSMSFDLSIVQIWGSLTSGATIALASQIVRKDPQKLAHFMRHAEVTITYIPATQFSLLLEHNSDDLRECSKFRRALFAGEYLPARTAKAIYDLKTPVTIFNQWGPTETTVQTSSHKTAYPSFESFNIPIGKPVHNCSHYIVDTKLKPVPATVVGELCIGGAQIGLEYLNRSEISEQVFVEDPFVSKSFLDNGWTRMYRTGDKGSFLPNGEMQFKGRISGDKQIKLRGYRIDTAEIENELFLALKANESFQAFEVTVLPRQASEDSTADDRQLIAFIAAENTHEQSVNEQQDLVNEIHKIISISLNEYMLPNGYQFLESLPKLISGKLDIQSLLCRDLNLVFPSLTQTVHSKDHKQTEDDRQILQHVTDMFRTVLNLAPDHEIDLKDNFFDLGGQSFLLLRLQSRLQRQFKVKIPLLELFQEATPAGIARKYSGTFKPDLADISNVITTTENIDWKSESRLPTKACYYPAYHASQLPRENIQRFLLTGVDTFVGVHALQRLLTNNPHATVHVTGTETVASQESIVSTFQKYGLLTDMITAQSLDERVRIVPGSLAAPHLGLEIKAFRALGEHIQAIFHVGAQVSLLKTYTDLKQINVNSTLDLIELASLSSTLTEIHYLSTWSVAHLQAWNGTDRTNSAIDLDENSPAHFQPSGDNRLGYFKSRWVAEVLLGQAARRGLPVSIYRGSAVTSPTTSSIATPEDNFTHNMILEIIEQGEVPDIRGEMVFAVDFVPVDYLVGTMMGIAGIEQSKTQDMLEYYHIGNGKPLLLKDLRALIAQVRQDGRPATIVPVADWIEKIRRSARTEKAKIEWAVFKEYMDLGHTMFSLRDTRTQDALLKLGQAAPKCPPVDEEYLKHMLQQR